MRIVRALVRSGGVYQRSPAAIITASGIDYQPIRRFLWSVDARCRMADWGCRIA
jgi:hypothetical protein